MALLNNGARNNLGGGRFIGGVVSLRPESFRHTGEWLAWTTNQDGRDTALKTAQVPDGYYPPAALYMPVTAGALSSRLQIIGEGEVSSADVWAVKLAEAALTGSGGLTAVGSLIVQLIAAISGSGAVTDADIKAFLQAVAALTGSGEVSDADLEGLGEHR